MSGRPPNHAFTQTYRGVTNQLITPVSISEAYDGAAPPNPLPQAIQTNGLWDTGATRTSITAGLAAKLGLVATGTGVFTHAGGQSQCNNYIVNLVLPNKVTVQGVPVTECTLPQHFEILIGMDIISQGDFHISHVGRNTTFSFRIPSIEAMDFVKQNQTKIPAARAAGIVGVNAKCPCGSGKKYKKCCQNAV